jgi:hypothetical protein
MNTQEVYEVLGYLRKAFVKNRRCFFTVLPCKELLEFKIKPPFLLVVNTSPAPLNGHWCAFLMLKENGPLEFFDAFCMPPEFYNTEFPTFIRRMKTKLRIMPRPIQCYDSNACGPHALRYLYYRVKGKPISFIYSKVFKSGCRSNDSGSKKFVKKIIKNYPNWYRKYLFKIK